jgi:hypothetical protein
METVVDVKYIDREQNIAEMSMFGIQKQKLSCLIQ